MSTRSITAPFEEAAAIAHSYRGHPDGRARFIQTSIDQLRKICRTYAQCSETAQFLLQEADRLLATATNDVAPAVVLVAVLVELSQAPALLKDAADLLWRVGDRVSTAHVGFVAGVFLRVAQLGPPDAFGAVVERIVRTFGSASDAPYAKKLLAVHLIVPVADHHPNLLLSRLHPFFSGAWSIAKDMVEGDGGRGAPRLKEAFARVVELFRRVASSFPGIHSELNDRLRAALKSRRDVDIAIGIAFMEPVLSLRTPSMAIPYSELWGVLWPLRERENLRFQLLTAFVALAKYDPISFTVDRRGDREKQDAAMSRQQHRSVVMDWVEEMWRNDASPETSHPNDRCAVSARYGIHRASNRRLLFLDNPVQVGVAHR